jgi:hypothetical protein
VHQELEERRISGVAGSVEQPLYFVRLEEGRLPAGDPWPPDSGKWVPRHPTVPDRVVPDRSSDGVHLSDCGVREPFSAQLAHEPFHRGRSKVLHGKSADLAVDDVIAGEPGVQDLGGRLAIGSRKTRLQPPLGEDAKQKRVVSRRSSGGNAPGHRSELRAHLSLGRTRHLSASGKSADWIVVIETSHPFAVGALVDRPFALGAPPRHDSSVIDPTGLGQGVGHIEEPWTICGEVVGEGTGEVQLL